MIELKFIKKNLGSNSLKGTPGVQKTNIAIVSFVTQPFLGQVAERKLSLSVLPDLAICSEFGYF